MSPFPDTRTIHPDWSRHHRPVVAGSLTGRCTITPDSDDGGGWDPIDGPTDPTTPVTPLWTGEFRAQALSSQAQPRDAAGQTVVVRSYLIVIDAAAPEAPLGARVTVDECPDDPALVDKTLTVTGITHGSHRFEWDLYADLDLTNQPGGGMSVAWDFSEFRTLAADLSAAGDRVGALGAAAVRKSATDLQARAQIAAPVDTGFLQGSISTSYSGDGRFGAMEAEVGPTASYGVFVEGGTSRMAPRPFLFPALDAVTPGFEAAMAQIIDQSLGGA